MTRRFPIPLLLAALLFAPSKTAAAETDCPASLSNVRRNVEEFIAAGEFAAAESHLRRCMEPWRGKLAKNDHEWLASTAQLGMVLSALGRIDEAEALLRENYRLAQDPANSSTRAFTAAYLGSLYRFRGDTARALPLLRIAHARFEESLGPDHPSTGQTLAELALAYLEDGKLALAETAFIEARRVLKKNGLHSEARSTLMYIGALQAEQGRLAEAETNLRTAMETDSDTSTLLAPTRILGLYHLARLYRVQKKNNAADEYYRIAIAAYENSPEKPTPLLQEVVAEYADFLKKTRSPEARVWAARAKSLRLDKTAKGFRPEPHPR